MNKKKIFMLVSILSLLYSPIVRAECNEEEFKQVEAYFRIEKNYNHDDKSYEINIYELPDGRYKYKYVFEYDVYCGKVDEGHFYCIGFKPGTTLKTVIDDNENGGTCKFQEIKFNELNPYYQDPLCSGIEEFVLCQETYEGELDRKTFENRVEVYKETKKEEQEKKPIEEKKEESLHDVLNKYLKYAKKFIEENIQYIVIGLITFAIITITITVSVKRFIKRRRLE